MIPITSILIGLTFISSVLSGIIRQDDFPLLANERISKRSIPEMTREKRYILQEQFRTPISEDLDVAANTVLGYRLRRTRSVDIVPLLRDNENISDLDLAENVVFFPLFRTKKIFKRRSPRNVQENYKNDIEIKKFVNDELKSEETEKVIEDGSKMKIQ
nr:uncharacterized protein LOC111429196 [Onthophagus taurus]